MNKKFCDRCEKEIPPESCRVYIDAEEPYFGPGEPAGTHCGEPVIGADLCDDCNCEFIDFMRGCKLTYDGT